MPVLTTNHHVQQALRFYAAPNKYFGIGRTTAWPAEPEPPDDDMAAASIDEAIGYKPVTTIKLLVEDVVGSFVFGGKSWTEVLEADAEAEGAFYVYVEARIEYGELPLSTFRQTGLFTGLVKQSGAGVGALLPSEVADPGKLELIDNHEPRYRAADKVDVVAAILRF